MFCLSDSSPSGTVSLGLKSFFWRPPPHQATEACLSLPLSSPKTSFWTLWVSYTFPNYCLVSWLVRGLSHVQVCCPLTVLEQMTIHPSVQWIPSHADIWESRAALQQISPSFPFILCWFHLLFRCIWIVFLVKETKPEVLLEVHTNGASTPLGRKEIHSLHLNHMDLGCPVQ